jgi:type I restriction enzyme S subunit
MLVESNEPWLGKVPADWTRSRIRNVATLSPGYSGKPPGKDERCAVVPMESLSTDGRIDVTDQQPFEEITPGLTLFEAGDVLFAKITPCMENGKGAFVTELPTRYAFGSTEFHVLRSTHAVHARFLYYYTYNPIYRAYAAENMVGAAGQKRVASLFVKDTRLFLPPFPEQERIAAYLDASCAALDAAVAAKRHQLDTLDALVETTIFNAVAFGLRDGVGRRITGAVFLPEIPREWRFERLKSVAGIRYGLGQPPGELDTGVQMIRATDIDAGTIRREGLLRIDPEELPPERNLYLKADEIIVVRSGAYTGDSAIVPPDLEGCVAGYDMVVTVNRGSPRFVAYALLSRYVLDGQIFLLTLRAAQPHLNAEELGSVRLALPPTRKEQETIADFLDAKLAEVKRIAAGIESQIATLTAYRKSLIHECVTGQRRITESDLKQVNAHG